MSAATEARAAPASLTRERALPDWWPLAALTLLAAALRLSTLGLQSFWYDEAFTPVHVLHPSLFGTLHSLTRTENSPPLWYVVEWVFYRVLGSGEWALRLPSALAGIALVPVAWGIGRELAGRAAAIATAAIVAVSPIFVWYSQEARVYGLYALVSGVLVLCFLRLVSAPGERSRAIAFAVAGAVGLLTHYFVVFLLIAMTLWLLWRPETRRRCLPALIAIGVVGLALLPLISAQGGRNTSWIGEWPLKERLEAIPRYFLTGYNGGPLGHAIELLVALPLLAACGYGLWWMSTPSASTSAGEDAHGTGWAAAGEPSVEEDRCRRGAAIALWLTACGFGIPLLLAIGGADYLAPRNVLGAMVPLAGLIAVLGSWPRTWPFGAALLALGAGALLAITIDVDLSPRLQRADWRGLVRAIPAGGGSERAYTTELLGSAPLEHYIRGLRKLPAHRSVSVREIVETGEPTASRKSASAPTGFRLVESRRLHGLVAYRFISPVPVRLSEEQLRHHVVSDAEPWVLVPGNARWSR